ncbi:hypothetical protein DXG03_002633 [Asterophora parasitica]|uniref:Rab-GAP TBC domain-containing protein n=1 Tax=Asterophora parasitica TaxID=117018 RepID=A0A9P7GAU0_9AGAR|nr:hypothetical protein DXG03_002633 [Asterophora parasitica]
MHEVLASLYYAVAYDSLPAPQPGTALDNADVHEVCSRTWVAGDAWALFESVMSSLSKWYEWREQPQNPTSRHTSSLLATHVNLNIPDGQLEIKPYIAPIVEACNHIQFNFLRATDPLLWKHMQAAGIEPQIYGIRWLRLLFTREFNMTDSMKLWDGLFACDPTFELAQWLQVTGPQMGLPEMIARGLIERGESLGINKTLMSAVSELRRNIPDLTASLTRTPNVAQSTFPLMDERPPEERPPWEPRSRFEMEREISQMRSTNKRLGDSLGWIVDVLLQDEAESTDLQRLKKQKQEALESLSYVRDVLMGNVNEIEEGRLVGDEESLRRRSREVTSSHNPIAVVVPPPPPPVSVTESRPLAATSRDPRRRSPPSGSPPVVQKDWDYSRRGFSRLNAVPAEGLPRLPPRSAGGVDVPVQQDPLGVL